MPSRAHRQPHQEMTFAIGTKTEPPRSSYWCGASRDELRARVEARRAQQHLPSSLELTFDPAIAATLAWNLRKLAHKMARRRAGGAR